VKLEATICIPSYCRAAQAERAIASALAEVRGALAEVLVLDDASPDSTFKILKERFKGVNPRRLRLLRNPRNLGLVANWNKGLRLARGKKIVFMGDDDTLLPNFLQASLEAHRAHPGLGFSFGGVEVHDSLGRRRLKLRPLKGPGRLLESEDLWSWIFYYFSPITLCSVLFDTSKLKAAGGFRPRAWYAADGDMYLRLASKHPAFYIPRLIAGNGYHGANLQEQMKDERMREVLAWIARKTPLPAGLGRLKRQRLEAVLRARYAATCALLWAGQGERAQARAALREAQVQASLVPELAGLPRLRLARWSALPWMGAAAVFASRALNFSRRRLAWPLASPAKARERLWIWTQ
jgi:glycosyltransferase involved in cell wall biosynthesis